MKKKSGFTLIELVIVIIILGILSAIAVPKFIDLQNDARQSAMSGLKASLETASRFTYSKAVIEAKETLANKVLLSGIKVRYGYPQGLQNNLKRVININNKDDWELNGSNGVITFLLKGDDSGCQLVYTQAAKGERPDIRISGCP
ncbi:prepilin-type N-terminal cleavage/methylation domain-containing protein [Psychromonas antarctica]|uniref:prepilin-type N-terminal cleavage/methylation domain-containing protein n=1 Tax=Psychromonas antarctica TaxID=67573 RepID=UPI0023AEA5C1|nr:prepilin-type N-terminal cleavage/methylation domain-containing protein [Psychromonas antarctica]